MSVANIKILIYILVYTLVNKFIYHMISIYSLKSETFVDGIHPTTFQNDNTNISKRVK